MRLTRYCTCPTTSEVREGCPVHDTAEYRKRSSSHSYGNPTYTCLSGGRGEKPKERFQSERSAKRAARRKRKWKGKDLPTPYFCEGCHGWHLGSGSGGWN